MPRSKKIKPVEAPKSFYKATLKVNGQILISDGESLEEAIRGLEVVNYKTNGNLEIVFGDKTIQRFLPLRQMRKLFSDNTGFTAEITRASMLKFLKMCLQ